MTSPIRSEPSASDELLLTIVHDLRAVLRFSMTRSQLIERSAGAGLDDTARETLREIIAADREMDRFLGRLADYANAGQLSARPLLALDAALLTAQTQFAPHPVELAVTGDAGEVKVARELVRVFAELIDNALKFSGNAPVRVHTENYGSQVTVTIRDGGIGVESGEEDRIFQPLIRLCSRDDYPGFGLGLAISRRIADAAGAVIRVTANPAGGAVASVTFPSLP